MLDRLCWHNQLVPIVCSLTELFISTTAMYGLWVYVTTYVYVLLLFTKYKGINRIIGDDMRIKINI